MKTDSFAKRLAIALREKHLKPVDLANKTGVDKASISHYLSGKYEPKNDKLLKFAEVLNVSENWLMGYDVPKERMDPLLNNEEFSLHYAITNFSISKVQEELLVKCTMLDEDNQVKVLEIVNMYLKEQGDLYLNTSVEKDK